MSPIKKLLFSPLFLISITVSLYFYKPILDKYLDVFFGAWGGLYEFSLLTIPIFFSSLCFVLFVTFTQDFKYALVIAIISAFIPFAFLPTNLSLVIGIGIILSLTIVYFNLQSALRAYINFQPSTLPTPSIKMLNTFLLLTLTAGFYLNANSIIQTQGFKLPDSLIDWAVDMSIASSGMNFKGEKQYLAQALTPEQIELLKQNPQILQQYGLKPEDLDALNQTQKTQPASETKSSSPSSNATTSGLKDTLKNQINNMLEQTIKPYLFVIPILLAFMFYSLGSLILWFFSLFLSPLISLIFSIFEKSGFVRFEKEMREVKKIVI